MAQFLGRPSCPRARCWSATSTTGCSCSPCRSSEEGTGRLRARTAAPALAQPRTGDELRCAYVPSLERPREHQRSPPQAQEFKCPAPCSARAVFAGSAGLPVDRDRALSHHSGIGPQHLAFGRPSTASKAATRSHYLVSPQNVSIHRMIPAQDFPARDVSASSSTQSRVDGATHCPATSVSTGRRWSRYSRLLTCAPSGQRRYPQRLRPAKLSPAETDSGESTPLTSHRLRGLMSPFRPGYPIRTSQGK